MSSITKLNNYKNIFKNHKIYNLENLEIINNETKLKDCIKYRREYFQNNYNINISKLPYKYFNYKQILNKNCENVVGYTTIPVGIVEPIIINNLKYIVPLSTTEGALIASINRGSKIINSTSCNYIESISFDKGITRAPIIKVNDLADIINLKKYIKNNFKNLKDDFESSSRYAKLKKIKIHYNGKFIHLRISALTGNAMGMNMINKGTLNILKNINNKFPDFKIISISGNLCTDKKPSAINWINGRGKTVICNTKLNINLFEKYSKIDVHELINLNIQKNLIGSSLAGSIGGFNAHASNIVASIFVSTGQDLGQIGTSSVGITDYYIENDNLNISLTMPSIEVGTIGGGTTIDSQNTCLDIMNTNNNLNSSLLSKIIASTVLCGELSLMISLCKGNLVNSHMKLNRGINKFI